MMTDYNDGKWHDTTGLLSWPVHGKSLVERVWSFTDDFGKSRYDFGLAAELQWASAYGKTDVFRVIKAHREPRVFWVNEFPHECFGELHSTREDADIDSNGNCGPHRIACHRVVIE